MKSHEFRLVDGLPASSTDLVDALDRMYPARCVLPGESLADANRYAGARDVVEYLIHIRDRQTRRSTPKGP